MKALNARNKFISNEEAESHLKAEKEEISTEHLELPRVMFVTLNEAVEDFGHQTLTEEEIARQDEEDSSSGEDKEDKEKEET
jgi:hypothetical protein